MLAVCTASLAVLATSGVFSGSPHPRDFATVRRGLPGSGANDYTIPDGYTAGPWVRMDLPGGNYTGQEHDTPYCGGYVGFGGAEGGAEYDVQLGVSQFDVDFNNPVYVESNIQVDAFGDFDVRYNPYPGGDPSLGSLVYYYGGAGIS